MNIVAGGKEQKVFICYCSASSEWAIAFAACLKAKHASVALPERPVDADKAVSQQTQQDLHESEYLVLVLGGEKAKPAPWVRFEWGAATGTEKRVLVISPRRSNIEAGELPLYARAMSFFVMGDPEQTAEEVAVELKRRAGSGLPHS